MVPDADPTRALPSNIGKFLQRPERFTDRCSLTVFCSARQACSLLRYAYWVRSYDSRAIVTFKGLNEFLARAHCASVHEPCDYSGTAPCALAAAVCLWLGQNGRGSLQPAPTRGVSERAPL